MGRTVVLKLRYADFQIVTRYRFRGEVVGSKVMIYENAFEVLNPNACDNGKRRLDAYEGQASSDELRSPPPASTGEELCSF